MCAAIFIQIFPRKAPPFSTGLNNCALFGIIPMCGLPFSIAALVCGIVALKAIKKDPDLSGSGRAWFGVILGGLMTAISLIALVMVLIVGATQPNRRF